MIKVYVYNFFCVIASVVKLGLSLLVCFVLRLGLGCNVVVTTVCHMHMWDIKVQTVTFFFQVDDSPCPFSSAAFRSLCIRISILEPPFSILLRLGLGLGLG